MNGDRGNKGPIKPDDDDFEEYMDGGSSLSRRYGELGSESPPPEVDARILAEAERAAKIHSIKPAGAKRWMVPVALAATVVLSFSLVMTLVLGPITPEKGVVESYGMAYRMGEETPRIDELRLSEDADERLVSMARSIPEMDMKVERQAATSHPARAKTADAGKPMAASPPGSAADVLRAYLDALEPIVLSDTAYPATDPTPGTIAEENMLKSQQLKKKVLSDRRLEEILQLYDQGEDKLAGEELTEFRAENSDHPVTLQLQAHGF
jgi:hypothetical protein